MLLLHLSLSCCVPVNVCYNFIHHCTKFQTGKIKLLPENDKKLFFVFLAMLAFDKTFSYMSKYGICAGI